MLANIEQIARSYLLEFYVATRPFKTKKRHGIVYYKINHTVDNHYAHWLACDINCSNRHNWTFYNQQIISNNIIAFSYQIRQIYRKARYIVQYDLNRNKEKFNTFLQLLDEFDKEQKHDDLLFPKQLLVGLDLMIKNELI